MDQLRKPRAYKNVCASECIVVPKQTMTTSNKKPKNEMDKLKKNGNTSEKYEDNQEKNNCILCEIGWTLQN